MTVIQNIFPLVVDHVYVWVSKAAPEMQILRDIGLQPKEKITVHTGQGSASQVVYFQNMYLELVWIEDEQELAEHLAGGGIAAPVRETWKETGVSPFGIGLHYRTPDSDHLPIETLRHQESWMPDDSYIEAISQRSPYTPLSFILHGSLAYSESRMGDMRHPLGVEQLTGLQITVTTLENPDSLMSYLSENKDIIIKQGEYPLMELTFDHHAQDKSFDLRPTLPLIINC